MNNQQSLGEIIVESCRKAVVESSTKPLTEAEIEVEVQKMVHVLVSSGFITQEN